MNYLRSIGSFSIEDRGKYNYYATNPREDSPAQKNQTRWLETRGHRK